MIKKFEEFVNESLPHLIGKRYNPKWVFKSFGFDENEIGSLCSRFYDEMYPIEELKKILEIVTSVVDDTTYAASLLKVLFDTKCLVEEKQDILDDFCKRFNGNKPLPIVINADGKIEVDLDENE